VSRYRPAHAALAGAFLISGLVFGTWAARIPALQDTLDLTDGDLAVALVALNGGAIAGLPAGAALVARAGSRTALRVALPVFALLLVPIAAAPTMAVLAAALAASAAVNSVVDVAVNANAVAVERQHGRAVLSRMHAMLTLGGILGAAGGALAAYLGTGVPVHFTLAAGTGAGAALLLGRWLAGDRAAPREGRPGPRPRARWLLGLGGLAFCVTLAEGSGNDWTAAYLHDLGSGDALAAVGVAAFLAAMTAGRLAGDHLRARVGPVRLLRGAALLAALGLGMALPLREPVTGLVGFALLGLGLSVTLPVILASASDRAVRAGRSPAAAVARVSTMAYLGSFAGPAAIGILATATHLGNALFLTVAAAGAAACGAGLVRGEPAGGRGGRPSPDRHEAQSENAPAMPAEPRPLAGADHRAGQCAP
jgi:MFS family permease